MSTSTAELVRSIPAAEYHAINALSNSGMKDLMVSPLRYWYLHVNPNAPERKESPEMWFGTGLHCRVLEPERFTKEFGCDIDHSDYPDALDTIQDLRAFLEDKGHKPKGTHKAGIIQQVQAVDPHYPIWDVLVEAFNARNAGRKVFSKEDWERLQGCAEALLSNRRIKAILADGLSEVTIMGQEETTGVPLKARLDWLCLASILDLKTFSQTRGKSIDKAVTDAIFYEQYYRQALIYSTLHQRFMAASRPTPFVLAFVESDAPHEVRLKQLRPSTDGTANVYWQRALIEVRHLCGIWKRCFDQYGTNPWCDDQDIQPLIDDEMPQLAFS